MDQLISALGQKDHLLMIDCRSLETIPTPIPANVAVMIVSSHVKHDLVAGSTTLVVSNVKSPRNSLA